VHSDFQSREFFAFQQPLNSHEMRVICTDGRFYEYNFPEDVRVDADHVHTLLSRHVKPDGRIDDLCLDFSGSYLPISHVSELRLVSALVVAYIMADQRHLNEVRAHARPPLPTSQS